MPIKKANRARYPKDWKSRSKFIRKVRARDRCEWCGAKNHEPHPVTGSTVVLTVAHVYDKRPENSQFDNLAALCQRCHLNHDRKEHVQNRQQNISGSQTTFEFKTKTKEQYVQDAREKKKAKKDKTERGSEEA